MHCRIADLYVDVPEVGDLPVRCLPYRSEVYGEPDIVIDERDFHPEDWEELPFNDRIYMESGIRFYRDLLGYGGMMLHASAVAFEGRAYLFSGPCGMGKSTHARLWQQIFGKDAVVFNDDKPAVRCVDGCWYAYGTPWCGKDGINVNRKVPLAGICFLRRGTENHIRRVHSLEAVPNVLSQTLRKFKAESHLNLMLSHTDRLIRDIPIFEFRNLPVPDAARLSYETMRRAAEEAGL